MTNCVKCNKEVEFWINVQLCDECLEKRDLMIIKSKTKNSNMKYFAWRSEKSAKSVGVAIWKKPDGSEVEVTEVVNGLDELSVNPMVLMDDLIFMGEVTKFVRPGDINESDCPF